MKVMNWIAAIIISCFFSMQATLFNVENHIGEELVVLISTDKTFGLKSIKVELGPEEKYKEANIGSDTVTSIMVFVGSRGTGRVAYDLEPPVTISSSDVSILPFYGGSLTFYKDREGRMRYI